MDAPRQPPGEGGAWVAEGGDPLLPQRHAPHPHISNFPAEASPGSWGWGKGTERARPQEGSPGVRALGLSICLGAAGRREERGEGGGQEAPPACPRPPHPSLGSLGGQLPVGAGPTPAHLGITTWGAGQTRGQGGCGGPSSAPRPPRSPGSAPACGCDAGRKWR